MSHLPSYADERDVLQAEMATQAPPDVREGFEAAAQRLGGIDFAASAPKVGDRAPDFTLPNQIGAPTSLAALRRDRAVVVLFYRGEWCPYCNLQLRNYQTRIAEFHATGARLVAISPQAPDHSLSMVQKHGLAFPVLSDDGGVVIERYGLRYEVDGDTRALLERVGNDLGAFNGSGGWILPAPATFLVDADGIVRYAHVEGDWTKRAEPSEVLARLADLR